MTWTRLILRGLAHHRRAHVGVLLGAAIATAVMVGALVVGDSVRFSLRAQALQRLGHVDAALVAGERLFADDLPGRLAARIGQADAAAVMNLRGTASSSGADAHAALVAVYGVGTGFLQVAASEGARAEPAPGEALLNAALARQLDAAAGDRILLRIEKPGALPRDLVMARIEEATLALQLTVAGVLPDDQGGRFGLQASQVAPFNLFLSRSWLQDQIGLRGRANLLLVSGAGADAANDALAHVMDLRDAQLDLHEVEGAGLCEVTSERVFIDAGVSGAALRCVPGAVGVLTYFVDGLRKGGRATPYSMVTALGPLGTPAPPAGPELQSLLGILPQTLPEDGIVVSDWLARDLRLKPGDRLDLDYTVMGSSLRLVKASTSFRVARIVPQRGAAADPTLMPAFPGLADVEHCRDWEPGMPIDLKRIRDVDEQYWEEHRGTPKAFVTLGRGQALWANRFGNLTAIRAPVSELSRLRRELPRAIAPRTVGLWFRDVRAPALAASDPATDFGGLFIGLSLFLIVAALLLTALLFSFGVGQRASEIGILLALGHAPGRVRRLFLGEGLALAVLGALPGIGLGLLYTRAVLAGLGGIWEGAVGQTTLSLHAGPLATWGGALLAALAALGAMALALRRAFRRPALALLRSRCGIPEDLASSRPTSGRVSLVLVLVCPPAALVLALTSGSGAAASAGAFFGAGALLLTGLLAAARRVLVRHGGSSAGHLDSLPALGHRNAGRRVGRSLAAVALLASGTFLVVAVQAYRLGPPADPAARDSGTGGFALFGRSSLPVLRDLGTAEGRDAFGLVEADLDGVSIVPLRVKDGDDASCLNLGLPQNPRLVGVRPSALAERGAFRFVDRLDASGTPWNALEGDPASEVVPAVGDHASVTWSLHKQVGDVLEYRDELGRPFKVKIVGTVANSILQGNLVIADAAFEHRFPSSSGQRMFLIDAPPDRARAVAARLTRALRDIGLELTVAADRLMAFNAVQNTYLLIFQALGGLGLLLGSAGLGLVVLQGALERRSELAVLSAVGLTLRQIRRAMLVEHGLLLALGLAIGALSALVAVLPGLLDPRGEGSLLPLAVLLPLLLASGLLCVRLATTLATRGSLLPALRGE